MNRLLHFAKTTIIGGLVVIIPVVLVFLVVSETVDVISVMIDPLISMLPVATIAGIDVTGIVALLVVLALCFAAGLAALTGPGAAVGKWVEARLVRLPGYKIFKAYTSAMVRSHARQLRPAVLTNPMDTQVLVFVIEEGESHCVVMVPNAPAVMAGSVQYVPRNRLTILDSSLAEVSQVLSEYGMGTKALFEDGSAQNEAKIMPT